MSLHRSPYVYYYRNDHATRDDEDYSSNGIFHSVISPCQRTQLQTIFSTDVENSWGEEVAVDGLGK